MTDHLPVFVYGTLRDGGKWHSAYRHHFRRARPAHAVGTLYALPFGYPAMTATGTRLVIGELVDLADTALALAALDDLETYREDGTGEYDRIVIEVTIAESREIESAWCYVYTARQVHALGNDAQIIESGDWLRRPAALAD